jgi:hypothetical protein
MNEHAIDARGFVELVVTTGIDLFRNGNSCKIFVDRAR